MALIIVLACLTTVVVAVGFFTQSLHEDILKQKISRPLCLGITLATTFGITLIGFGGITAFLGMTLDLLYPALALLAIYNLAAKLLEGPLKSIKPTLLQYRYVPIGIFLGIFAVTVLYRV
ncbi:MAG: hypothetical protein B7X06_04425 [Verrucomicrobia bacterium 21-51-4]|nr:MAG: hypothetical protein B7X06_04425 [Verrucomicrobia bacterium 21-51-4]